MQRISRLAIPLVLLGSAAAAAMPGREGPVAGRLLVPAGLELREGAMPEPDPAPVEPPARPDAPPPSWSGDPAIDQVVDQAVRHSLAGAAPGDDTPTVIADGAPLSARARQTLDRIAVAAGLDRAEMAAVTDTPRDQARFLVEQLFDPNGGEAAVRARYGRPGALAAASYRRLRDMFQVLDLSAAQKETVVDAVERALIDAGATGQVDDPRHELVEVDPGPRADRGRFERTVAQTVPVVRCLRPSRRADDRFYLLELSRSDAPGGGAVCAAPWRAASADAPPGRPLAPRSAS
jgi:hypothetical protein